MIPSAQDLLAPFYKADPRDVARALGLVEAWDRDFQARPRPTPEAYARELTVIALPRIARGHGGVAGVGVDLAEAALVLHLSQHWGSDPLFAKIVEAIASVANLMRKSQGGAA